MSGQREECRHPLTTAEYAHCTSAYVPLAQLTGSVRRVDGLSVEPCEPAQRTQGRPFSLARRWPRPEVPIDGRVARTPLMPNCLNLKIPPPDSPPRTRKPIRMLSNSQRNKSILKPATESAPGPSPKSVSFNSTYYIAPIPARQQDAAPSAAKNYESMYKEYLKSVQIKAVPPPAASAPPPVAPPMNGSRAQPPVDPPSAAMSQADDDDDMEVEMLEEEVPKRKRGRPKGSVRVKPGPKKRGWPLGVPRKPHLNSAYVKKPAPVATRLTDAPTKGKRGRPRKIIAFGFQSIVSDIKTVSLPSDLWSAHVSVTAKKSQVCFTRVMQAISSSVHVECDRSVKFNGSVNYLVRINNRDVDLLAAPSSVASLRDVEILLDIVDEIGINDPVLDYLNR